jgi:hypothetical protein
MVGMAGSGLVKLASVRQSLVWLGRVRYGQVRLARYGWVGRGTDWPGQVR